MRPQQSQTPELVDSRQAIRDYYLADEHKVIHEMIAGAQLSQAERDAISARAAELVRSVRKNAKSTIMEKFLAEYGLTTKEGVALMCLAEALLRVPDNTTIHELIEDKITSGAWGTHVGKASSGLINTATVALLMTSNLLKDSERNTVGETLRKLLKRFGEPVIRTVANQAMKEMGRQFVLGRDIDEAQDEAKEYMEKGYTYSYDMLGEAARTDDDAKRYYDAYSTAIDSIAKASKGDVRKNPGISVKLSALLARYEYGNKERVMNELLPRARELVKKAAAANARLAVWPGGKVRPEVHGASGERGVLGCRDQACPGDGAERVPCVYPQGLQRRVVPVLCHQTAEYDEPHLPAVRDPQRPFGIGHSGNGQDQGSRQLRVPAPPRYG